MPSKRTLVRDDPVLGFPGVVEVGPLLFTAGVDGHQGGQAGEVTPALAGEAEAQSENSYGKVQHLLAQAGVNASAVVRLDHFVSSMDWLARRQTVRGRIFGRPAALASTGVAAKMSGINMLTTAAVAVTPGTEKEVLVSGAQYGMENVSSAVRGGPFLFLSGLRGMVDPRSGMAVPEETRESFGAQAVMCYTLLQAILHDCQSSSNDLLRLDCFLRDVNRIGDEREKRRHVLGDVTCAATSVGLPFGWRGEVEITALAVAPGQKKEVLSRGPVVVVRGGGLLFVGECSGSVEEPGREAVDWSLAGHRERQVGRAIDILERTLRDCGSTLSRVVRLNVYLRDICFADRLYELLRSRFHESPPVLFVTGAELGDIAEVKVSAIAM